MLRIAIFAAALVLVGDTKVLVPPERTAIFPQDRAHDLLGLCMDPPEGITGFWQPEEKDLVGAEDHLEEYLMMVWSKSPVKRKEMPKWPDYYRQVGGIVRAGERVLFIAYSWYPMMNDPRRIADQKKELERAGRLKDFDPDWWKARNIFVNDGGSMFFRVIYDPKKKQFVWYDQNGNA